MNNQVNQPIAVQDDDEITVPAITRLMLAPAKAVYQACSEYTRNHFTTLATILLFTVMLCGAIFGISLSKFGFSGSTMSCLITLPIGVLIYGFIDRLVVMADAKKNAVFIKRSRYVIAFVFGMMNSFLIDSYWYKDDINAAIQQEIVSSQNAIQLHADSLSDIQRRHKATLYTQINTSAQELKDRNNALVQEAEGSSYSHHQGIGQIYAAKKAAFDRDSAEFARTNALMLTEAAKDDAIITALQTDAEQQKKLVPGQISHGINHSMELLHKAIFSSPLNMLIAFLMLVVAMVLELLPLLAKHYLDISEYFEHAEQHIQSHLANATIRTEQAIAREEHELSLAHERALQGNHALHALASLQSDMAHRTNVLHSMDEHLTTFSGKEADMQTRFPDHFEEHARPVFHSVYDGFHDSHSKAAHAQPITQTT